MPALRKSLAAITPGDFAGLICDAWAEDELLEFKATLPTAKGGPDKWVVDQSEIGQSAKRDVLAEVVAMANSYGGDVLLGIAETDEKPPRAAEIVPLPACVELAHRFEMAARDLIRPEIPMLSVRGVPTDGPAGVVVFRVPRSRAAPHRLEMKGIEKECYKRVRDRTESMTMREIQDLTFAVSRGLSHVESRLEEQSAAFLHWSKLDSQFPNLRRFGYRISATPLSADLLIERVYGVQEIAPLCRRWRLQLEQRKEPYDLAPVGDPHKNWRPILRGTQAVEVNNHRAHLQRLLCDGTILDWTYLNAPATDQAGHRSDFVLYPGWVFAAVSNVLESIERFRAYAGAQAVHYALEIAIGATEEIPVLSLGDRWYEPAGHFPQQQTVLPQYEVGEPEGRHDLVALIWRDFWNAAGVDAANDRITLIQ